MAKAKRKGEKMKKFSEQLTKELIECCVSAKERGESLTSVFSQFAKKHKKATGSVRNYYYFIMKDKLLFSNEKSSLSVEKAKAFSREEERDLAAEVLSRVKQGKSVRRAILDMAKGDEKLQLRIQNKFRNLLKLNPLLIEECCSSLGMASIVKKPLLKQKINQKNLCNEIDRLIERLKNKYSKENERLAIENSILKERILQLELKTNCSTQKFFEKSNKKLV